MIAPVRTIAPEITPVTLDEVKGHLRVDHIDDDDLIQALIGAAVDHLDGWTGILGRCLVEQTWRQDFERFASCLPLPLGPVIDITSVDYANAAGDPSTVDPSDYALKVDAGGRASVALAFSVPGPVSVVYQAGYETTPAQTEPVVAAKSTVPDAIKIAIILHIKMNYETLKSEERELYKRAFDALIAPYRRIGV